VTQRFNDPESVPYRELALRQRWLEQSGPLYEERTVTIDGGVKQCVANDEDGYKLSYASRLIVAQATFADEVTVKVRVK